MQLFQLSRTRNTRISLCHVSRNCYFREAGTFSGVCKFVLCERTAVTFSGAPNNKDIEAEIMKASEEHEHCEAENAAVKNFRITLKTRRCYG